MKTSQGGGKLSSVLGARSMVRTFLPYLRPHWPWFALTGVLAVAGTVTSLLKVWPLKFIFDEVLAPVDQVGSGEVRAVLVPLVVALLVVTVLDSLFALVRGYLLSSLGERVAAGLRTDLFAKLQRLPLRYHRSVPVSALTDRLTTDVDHVQRALTATLLDALSSVLTLIGVASVLIVLDWQLSLGLVLLVPLLVLVIVRSRRRTAAAEEDVREVERDLAAAAQESLAAIELIKSLGQEDAESARFADRAVTSMRALQQTARATSSASYAFDVVVAIATACLVWLGATKSLSGALSPGDLLIFILYVSRSIGGFRDLSRLPAQLARAAVRAERIAAVLYREPEIVDRAGAVPAPVPRIGMALERVSVAYVEGSLVLNGVDLEVPVGRTLAVVGPTSAGKSTIASLLCRLQDPDDGVVTLDGIDLRHLTLDSVHRHVGLVLQEAILFRATVTENIAYGQSDASVEQVVEAAKVADAHDFIQALPEGYDTVLVERGVSLSGGQRQRLALARAVLRGSPILVLDEPTTGLDARSERAVLEAIRRASAGRTTVLITSRMVAAMTADHIVVIDRGVVVERGDHESLLAAGGVYAGMCRLQNVTRHPADLPALVAPVDKGIYALRLRVELPPDEAYAALFAVVHAVEVLCRLAERVGSRLSPPPQPNASTADVAVAVGTADGGEHSFRVHHLHYGSPLLIDLLELAPQLIPPAASVAAALEVKKGLDSPLLNLLLVLSRPSERRAWWDGRISERKAANADAEAKVHEAERRIRDADSDLETGSKSTRSAHRDEEFSKRTQDVGELVRAPSAPDELQALLDEDLPFDVVDAVMSHRDALQALLGRRVTVTVHDVPPLEGA